MMNSRDVVQGLLTNGKFDRVGVFEHFWPETPDVWVAHGYPAISNGSNAVNPTDGRPDGPRGVDPYQFFDLDMHPVGGWFDTLPLVGYEELVAESDEWKVIRNGAGASLKYWKKHSGTPEHIDFRMTTREIWESDYRPHLLQIDQRRVNIPEHRANLAAGRARDKWCFYGHLFVWENMRRSLGDVCLFESLALDPGWIHDYNRVTTDFYKAHYKLIFEEAGLPEGIWVYEDLSYRNGLFASPKMFRDIIFPYYAELVEFFHSYGLPVVLHSCGNITQALPLVVDAGFDALNPMEVKSGCHPFEFAEQYRDKLAFQGGLDIRILETNDRATIHRGVVELVEGMKARGARYLFGTDHSVTPLVKYDSYCYALDVYREHAAY
jgi:uroporphyrinogen decarboxylase